ncbi:glycosyltransferase family 4 protein [Candidatus Parcubacteria bacterium]|nr:glycosyltransferase family 4 protein [Candidatus Parcubacteria bacterium]
MKLTYLTTKTYPASTADHIYIRELSKAFSLIPGVDFSLAVMKKGDDLSGIKTDEIKNKFNSRFFSVFIFLIQNSRHFLNRTEDNYILTNDFNIGVITLILRKIFFPKTTLVFDCHLLTKTWKDSFILNRADKIITTSEVLQDNVTKLVKNPEKVLVVYGGVDVKVFKEHPKVHVKNGHITYVGGFKTLGQTKGLECLIKSFKLLPNNFHLNLVGGNKEEISEYQKMVDDLSLSDSVTVTGKVDMANLAKIEISSDVLVIPYPNKTHFREYGFPMKVFEYLCARRPIVYSNLKIIDDFLKYYPHCFPFTPGDEESLAQTVMKASGYMGKFNYDIEQSSWKCKAQNIVNILRNTTFS